MKPKMVTGDLFDQPVECIVNSWNRNIVPPWLMVPHGVSGAMKKRAGKQTFKELRSKGPLQLGEAVATAPGNLTQYRCIIHVASIDLFAKSSESAIQDSVKNAMKLAQQMGIKSIAFPMLGSGSGRFPAERAEELMIETLAQLDYPIEVTLVRFDGQH